jgi:hypothetical protein
MNRRLRVGDCIWAFVLVVHFPTQPVTPDVFWGALCGDGLRPHRSPAARWTPEQVRGDESVEDRDRGLPPQGMRQFLLCRERRFAGRGRTPLIARQNLCCPKAGSRRSGQRSQALLRQPRRARATLPHSARHAPSVLRATPPSPNIHIVACEHPRPGDRSPGRRAHLLAATGRTCGSSTSSPPPSDRYNSTRLLPRPSRVVTSCCCAA